MKSVPIGGGVPLKKAIAKCNIHNMIKKSIGVGAKDLPCTSSSSPQKALKPRNPAPRINQLFYVNTTAHHSLLDTKTEIKLESNITEIPVKCRRRPYLQIIEARDLTPLGLQPQTFPKL